MPTDLWIVDDNIVGNITTQRDNVFVKLVYLIWLRTAADNQPEAAAALHNAASWKRWKVDAYASMIARSIVFDYANYKQLLSRDPPRSLIKRTNSAAA